MDHVHPRCVFPDQLHDDIRLVSAPACQVCHDANKKDDLLVRNLLVSTEESERHPAVIAGLAEKRDKSLDRSWQRSGFEVNELIGMMEWVDVLSPGGIYLETRPAFRMNKALMDRFLERLSRALLWYEFKQPYFLGSFPSLLNYPLPPQIYGYLLQHGKALKVHDVFAYGLLPLSEDETTLVVAQFYGCLEFSIKVTKTPIDD